MITITGTVREGKIILDKKAGLQSGKVLVTFIDVNEDKPTRSKKNIGKILKKISLDGIWKNRGIKNGSRYSEKLRSELENCHAG